MVDLCTPQVASGPLADLGYCEEVCYGQTPETVAMKTVRRRSTTLTLTKDSYDSEEVRSDRMVSDSRHGMRRASGDIVTELSPGAHADFMAGLLGGVWSKPGGVTIGTPNLVCTPLASGAVQVVGSGLDWFGTLGYKLGDVFKISGSGNATYDGLVFTVFASPSATTILCWPSTTFTGTSAATLTAGTLAGQARCPMGSVLRSFLMERAFTDIGSFILYHGIRVNQMAVELPPTGVATATYSMIGQDASPIGSASIDGVAQIDIVPAGAGDLTFDAAAKTITRTTGSWITDGVTVGSKISISGSGITDVQNRNLRTVVARTATVLTVAEAIQSGTYTANYTITRVGLPDYTLPADEDVLVAVSGVLLKDGEPCATVTGMNFSVDNQMSGAEVTGTNIVPMVVFGNQCMVTGQVTVLFDRGGLGEDLYNAFDQESDDITLIMRLDTADGKDAISFVFPRVKMTSGSIGDAVAEGLPVQMDFRALRPRASHPEAGTSQIVIGDTTVVAA